MPLLAEIAQRVNGKVIGDESLVIEGVGSLSGAVEGEIAQYSNKRYRSQLLNTQASAVILREESVSDCPVVSVVVAEPQFAFAQVAMTFDKRFETPIGSHPTAQVDPTATLGANVRIGPYVTVGPGCVLETDVELCSHVAVGAHVTIGRDTSIRENSVLYHDVQVGERCVIHANTVIGTDGFGIAPGPDGKLHQIPQVGRVVIGNDVLIGSSSTVDRGTVDDTIIHDDVKIDDQVHIAHNCVVGAHSILCGRVSLAGSVTIGQHCVLAGAVGIAGEGPVTIADGVEIGSMTFVSRDITEPGRYSGSTIHTTNRLWRRNVLRFNELDSMAKRLNRIEKKLNQDTKTAGSS